jgi:acetyl-CoA acetyltransferase
MSANDPMVVGIGRSPYSRNSGRTTWAMAVEACRLAVEDAGLPMSEVDGIVEFNTGDSTGSLNVAYGLGLPGLRYPVDIANGGNIVTLAVALACQAVQTGKCKSVLVYRSLNSRSGKRLGTFTGNLEIGGDARPVVRDVLPPLYARVRHDL